MTGDDPDLTTDSFRAALFTDAVHPGADLACEYESAPWPGGWPRPWSPTVVTLPLLGGLSGSVRAWMDLYEEATGHRPNRLVVGGRVYVIRQPRPWKGGRAGVRFRQRRRR